MASKARELGLRLRPHFKTHQSLAVGGWFGREGTEAIAVSSLAMAEYFAAGGWSDITLATPLNPRELDGIRSLAGRIRLGVTVDSVESLRAAGSLRPSPDLWLELDCGYGRSGVRWSDAGRLSRIATEAAEHPLRGVLVHAGDTYAARGEEQVRAVHRRAIGRLEESLSALGAARRDLEVSWGDTPSCRLADDFGAATELRPGNYVFFDMMQLQVGSCGPEDIAVSVVCPVISVPAADRAVLHCGAVHLSKEYLTLNGRRVYGALARLNGGPPFEPDLSLPLVGLSQEHGVVRGEGAGSLRPGDLVSVVPVHSCLACDLYGGYLLEGGGVVSRRPSCAEAPG